MVIKRWFIIFLILFSLLISKSAVAQEAGQRWVCLKPTICDQAGVACGDEQPVHNGPKPTGNFSTGLETYPNSPPAPNSLTYIVACSGHNREGGGGCSTGSRQTDMVVYGQDNTAIANVGALISGSNPTQSDGNGGLGSLTWQAPKIGSTKFYALNYITAAVTPSVGNVTPSVPPQGDAGALQQGTFVFSLTQADLDSVPENLDQDCLKIRWDPYGRVFDINSLEPVFGASVTLFKKRADGSFTQMTTNDVVGGNIINPQTVKEDGAFSFIVDDGSYKLGVSSPNYSFPVSEISKIHPNYSQIYYDVYPALTGEEIVQAGKIEHRDIPVEPLSGVVTNNPPKLMEYFYTSQVISQTISLQGTVSHPLAKLTFYSIKPIRYRQVGAIQADKNGKFSYKIDQSKFEPGESFGEIDLAKVDLTLLGKSSPSIIKNAQAESNSVATIKLDPILTYLQGYAYDSSGKIIPNATVGIYLTFSNKPYYKTKADDKGFFKIPSEFIPNMAYGLRYTTAAGTTIKVTTTEFITKNQKYLTDNKIDLQTFKNQAGKPVTKALISKAKGEDKDSDQGSQTSGKGQTGKGMISKQTNNLILLIGVLVFLLIAVIIILIVHFVKKKRPEPSPTTPSLQ